MLSFKKFLLEQTHHLVGTCRDFDDDGECTNSDLPYINTNHFAGAEENAEHISKEEFAKHNNIPKHLLRIHNHKDTKHLHDKVNNVYMMHDTKKDIHHLFTK